MMMMMKSKKKNKKNKKETECLVKDFHLPKGFIKKWIRKGGELILWRWECRCKLSGEWGKKKKVIKKEKKGRKKNTKSIGDGAFEPTRWITSGFYHR